ncbi:MAG: IclR family transcriptional regulator, partial [Pseudolysinimonas sp.]
MANSKDGRSVAGKVFAIADAFSGGDALTLAEVQRRTGLPRSTAHRLLTEWVAWEGLEHGEDGRYRVGLKLWQLGIRQPTARRLRAIARPVLAELLEVSHEHVHLAVRDGLGVVYLERLSAPDAVALVTDVGSRVPLHATAVGQVLLAFAEPSVLDEALAEGLSGFTANTIVAENVLRRRLSEIRAVGVGSSREEFTPGAFSVAAPVYDVTGSVVA